MTANHPEELVAHTGIDRNHERIWLSPLCDEERTWCQDSQGGCDECGESDVEYIRADIASAQLAAAESTIRNRDETIAALRAEVLEEAAKVATDLITKLLGDVLADSINGYVADAIRALASPHQEGTGT